MTTKVATLKTLRNQLGLTMVELMVSIAISVMIMSGVVQVLVVSKSNFVAEQELSGLQENARYALKYMGDQIRMAGFSSCNTITPKFANTMNASHTLWYVSGLGVQGYEYDGGVLNFPDEFSADVLPDNDAIVVRRGEDSGLRVINHVDEVLTVNKAHAFKPGQPFVIATPGCSQVTLFQSSGPVNAADTATTIEHETGGGVTSPGNCVTGLNESFTCATPLDAEDAPPFKTGSRVMALRSEAYYVGASESDPSVPALFRERMYVDTTTSDIETMAEELVQGVEYMHLEYGLDNDGDNGTADIYLPGDHMDMVWDNVVTVRIVMRMRSVNPVYASDTDYDEFQGIADTDGSDRFMRQIVSTTIRIRNA